MDIITRGAWGARWGPNPTVPLPYTEVIIHTAAGGIRSAESSLQADTAAMRAIEKFHHDTRKWPGGVGYIHVVMRSGRVFEGQGFGRRGTHTESRNAQWGICLDGHGDLHDATPEQWAAVGDLIRHGLETGRLTPTYKVSGHRNYSQKGKTCPGNLIYPRLGELRGLTPTPPEDDDMTPDQADKLDDTAAAVSRLEKQMGDLAAQINDLAVAGYQGHPGALVTLGQISDQLGTGDRSIRTLLENNYNRIRALHDLLFDGAGPRPVIARVLGLG